MLTVGEIFKKERNKKNLSLGDVEKKTKIRKKYLEAIEQNNWQIFPSKIYIEGIIKNYCDFLGLSYQKVITFFRRDYKDEENVSFKKRLTKNYFVPESKKLFLFLFLIILFLTFLYFGWQLKKFLSPPTITFISPQTTHFFKENQINIKAKVDPETIVYIFNQKIYHDTEGYFEYLLPLKKGKNELVIKLIGANGKTAVIKKVFIKK